MNPQPQSITLARRQAMPLAGEAGARIACTRGRLWITESGCRGDVVLEAGESYTSTGRGVPVVQALWDAEFTLRAPVAVPASPLHLPEWLSRLRLRLQPNLRQNLV